MLVNSLDESVGEKLERSCSEVTSSVRVRGMNAIRKSQRQTQDPGSNSEPGRTLGLFLICNDLWIYDVSLVS